MQPHPTCGVVNLAVVQQVLLASPPNVLLLEGMTPWNYTSSPKKERQDLPVPCQLGGGERHLGAVAKVWGLDLYTVP